MERKNVTFPGRSFDWLVSSECLITSCDYRVRYVQHAVEQEKDSQDRGGADSRKGGFRLWSSGPNFDTDLPQDVTGIVGHTAYLTCRVFDRTNSTVSTSSVRCSGQHGLVIYSSSYCEKSFNSVSVYVILYVIVN